MIACAQRTVCDFCVEWGSSIQTSGGSTRPSAGYRPATRAAAATIGAVQRIAVFCGSSIGADPAYAEAARALAVELVSRRLELVYGGGNVGLMGVLADAALAASGRVIGVIPQPLAAREIAHRKLTELRVVASMHERKAVMAALADGFVALPGGFGTFEEIFEAITWTQLGVHAKPCGFLNVRGYFDPLIAFLDRAAGQGFISLANRRLVLDATGPATLLDAFAAFDPPSVPAWIELDQT